MIDISKLKIRSMSAYGSAEHGLLDKYRYLKEKRVLTAGATNRYLRPLVGKDNVLAIVPDPIYEGELRQLAEDLDAIDSELARCEERFMEYETACRDGLSTDRLVRKIELLKNEIRRAENELQSLADRKAAANRSSQEILARKMADLEEKLVGLRNELQEAQERHRKLYEILN